MKADLIHKKKTETSVKRHSTLVKYDHTINNVAFFQRTISERMALISSFYKKYPNVSAKTASEMTGNSFDEESERIPENLYQRTFYQCEYNDLQFSTLMEHKARLALMKHAVDFVLYKKAGLANFATDQIKFKIGGHILEMSSFDELPMSFKQGIDNIKNQSFFFRYPVFWQWFMWVFGGFILLDKEEEEYVHLSKCTGIPMDEIPNALRAYDELFPTEGGWFSNTSPISRIKKLKMFPTPFMGLGSHYRKHIYIGDKDLRELPVTGVHTLDDLISWNNSTVDVLMRGN